MALHRREYLSHLSGLLATAGLISLAGCSSSCPDSDGPTPEETIAGDATPTGPFETTPAGTWPVETGDAANTGHSSLRLPDSSLTVRWRTQLAIPSEDGVGVVASAPVVGDERVYVADSERVHALSLRTGELEWQSETLPVTETEQYGVYRPETVAPRIGPESQIYVGLETGLAALDPADGTIRWRANGQSAVAPPTVVENLLVAQGEDLVRAFDPDGTERWSVSLDRDVARRQPAATGDAVVLRTERGLKALDPETGDTRWTRSIRAESPPSIDDGTVFAGIDEGLIGLDVVDGSDRFTYSRGEYMTFDALVIAPETVYVVEHPPEAGASSFAFSRTENGVEPRWCSAVGDGTVTAATDDIALGLFPLGLGPRSTRSVGSFTAERGEMPWAITGGTRSDAWPNPPALLADAIVVSTRGGRVLAVSGGGET